MMDGRVKTLHPKIHGGLLGLRDNPVHLKDMQENDIQPIDMVVVNLYPFDYDGLTMLGWSYYRLNNMREARVLFQKALLHTPAGSSASPRSGRGS